MIGGMFSQAVPATCSLGMQSESLDGWLVEEYPCQAPRLHLEGRRGLMSPSGPNRAGDKNAGEKHELTVGTQQRPKGKLSLLLEISS